MGYYIKDAPDFDVYGDAISKGPYSCNSCLNGDSIIEYKQPAGPGYYATVVLYCGQCDDIITIREVR